MLEHKLNDEHTSLYPKLKLPSDLTKNDFLVVVSGPSFADFDLNEINSCSATIIGGGNLENIVRLDHYVLVDHLKESIPGKYPIYTCDSLYSMAALEVKHPYFERLQIIPNDCQFWCTGIDAVYMANYLGAERIFIIGLDGISESEGVTRTEVHAASLKSYEDPVAVNTPDKKEPLPLGELTQISAIRWAPFRDKLYGLSSTSLMQDLIPFPVEFLDQPYAKIDRHASLIVVHLEDGEFLSIVEILCQRWRNSRPAQAIVIVTKKKVEYSLADPLIILRSTPLTDQECLGFSCIKNISFAD